MPGLLPGWARKDIEQLPKVEILNVLYTLEALKHNNIMPGLLPGWIRKDIEQLPNVFFCTLEALRHNYIPEYLRSSLRCARWDKCNYYIAESVFAMRLVNLRSVTCYTDQNFKENAHFGALNLLPRKKGLNKVIRRLTTLKTLTLAFNILNCLFVNEGDEETNS